MSYSTGATTSLMCKDICTYSCSSFLFALNPLAAGGTHVSISTLPEGHICPKSIDLTTFSLANKIYHI